MARRESCISVHCLSPRSSTTCGLIRSNTLPVRTTRHGLDTFRNRAAVCWVLPPMTSCPPIEGGRLIVIIWADPETREYPRACDSAEPTKKPAAQDKSRLDPTRALQKAAQSRVRLLRQKQPGFFTAGRFSLGGGHRPQTEAPRSEELGKDPGTLS